MNPRARRGARWPRGPRRRARPALSAAILGLILLASTAPAVAQGDGPGYGGRSVGREGPYTEEQADRGARAYDVHCAGCHRVGLEGVVGVTPPLAGREFLGRWEGASLENLFHYVRATMPLDAPRTLSDRTYLDVLAHLLRENGVEAGDTELRPTATVLSRHVLPEAPEEASVPQGDEAEPPPE